MSPDAAPASDAQPHSTIQSVRRVACPGSFDPVTNGHLNVFERASRLFEEVVVLVTDNPVKQTLFSVAERQELIQAATAHLPNIVVDSVRGLLVDYCTENAISAVAKGLRGPADFEYEIQMAQMNLKLADVETLFLTTNPSQSYVSSSLVKQVAKYGGDVREFVPPAAYDALTARLAEGTAST